MQPPYGPVNALLLYFWGGRRARCQRCRLGDVNVIVDMYVV